MKVVKRVLLLDDKVRHTNRFDRSKPGKVESLLESYGQSLKENGFEAKAPPALDGRRFPLQTHALPKVTRIVRGWIDEFCPDGIVFTGPQTGQPKRHTRIRCDNRMAI